MWLSVDPLAEKYPGISSYAYVANNPINAIDPDGRDIVIVNPTDNEQLLYENGKAYHTTKDSKGNLIRGDEYGGGNDFVDQVITDLNKISSTKQGGHIVNELSKSNSVYSISDSGDPSENTFNPDTNEIKYSQQKSGIIDGVSMNKSHIKLGHELAHGYDKDRGFDVNSTMFGGEMHSSEINAVKFENYLRAMDGESTMRTRYGQFNLKRFLGGSSSNFFKGYIAPLGRYEREIKVQPPPTNQGVDNTRVYVPPFTIRYDIREKKISGF